MAATRDHLFEQLFAQASDAALILDPGANRVVAANAAACALLGYPEDELLATPISAIHPGELPQLQEFVGAVLRDGHGTTVTLTCRTMSEDYLPIELSLYAFASDDGRPHILGLVRDRSEHRARTVGD